jgi:VIT1/CCC1 family predicted Fe2+/Mn2+ transporter
MHDKSPNNMGRRPSSDAVDRWQYPPEVFEGFDAGQNGPVLATALVFALGALVFVVALVLSGVLAAIVGSVVMISLVGLAVAMLSP